ncbi:hypothetical protein ACFQYP_21290 [Nonomuraea antimicrobica]
MDLPDELDLPESRWNRFPTAAEPDLPDPSWNRFQEPKPPPWPRRLAAALSVALVVPLTYAMPAQAASRPAPSTQQETPVPGTRVPVQPAAADPAQKQAWQAPPAVTWPQPQKAELGGATARTLAAGFPVRLAPQQAKTTAAAEPEPVTVELLDTDRLGLAMRVSPARASPRPRPRPSGRPGWRSITPVSATPSAATTAPAYAWSNWPNAASRRPPPPRPARNPSRSPAATTPRTAR